MLLESQFSLKTRRQFLRQLGLGAAATWTLPIFLERTFGALEMEAATTVGQAVTGKDAPILVVLQMAGGNDGLNTLVPYADDAYHRARPDLGIGAKTVLQMGDYVGLNPGMTGLKSLYDDGLLGIVQGAGYPNPNRSHFRSTEIWQTATDADRYSNRGWIGNYFDNACQGADATVGVTLTKQTPQAFAAETPTGIALAAMQGGKGRRGGLFGRNRNDEADEELTAEGGSIDMLGGAVKSELGPLEYLQRTALDARMSDDKIKAILAKNPASASFPKNQLGQQFSLIARLIAGQLPTRVYYLSQGGYDTHNNQERSHNRLLAEFSDGLSAFIREMKQQGNDKRVLVMTFSEFGRRVAQNSSGGTDHGTAAPMFLAGGAMQPGLYGKYPSLTDLNSGDLKHTADFRGVYATILDRWLRADSSKILGTRFEHLPFLS